MRSVDNSSERRSGIHQGRKTVTPGSGAKGLRKGHQGSRSHLEAKAARVWAEGAPARAKEARNRRWKENATLLAAIVAAAATVFGIWPSGDADEAAQAPAAPTDTLPTAPVPALDTGGNSAKRAEERAAGPSQVPVDVQPDTGVDTPRARPDDAVNVQPGVSADPSGRAQEASGVDVQPDTAGDAGRAAERTPDVGN